MIVADCITTIVRESATICHDLSCDSRIRIKLEGVNLYLRTLKFNGMQCIVGHSRISYFQVINQGKRQCKELDSISSH